MDEAIKNEIKASLKRLYKAGLITAASIHQKWVVKLGIFTEDEYQEIIS